MLELAEQTFPKGSRRLRVAAERTVALDALAARAISRGKDVRKEVPGHRIDPVHLTDGTAASRDGVRFPIGVLLRPLLMSDRPSEPLFGYQRSGVAWLLSRRRALLADDMGLGKTLQTIAAIRRLVYTGRIEEALIVAPNTLLANWEDEFSRWAPELAVTTVSPQGGTRDSVWISRLRRAHVIITNYEQIRAMPTPLADRTPELVIADEAHRLRNEGSQTVAGFRTMQPRRLWGLTGTPIERDAEDLATLLSVLEPARFSADDSRLGPSVLRARARPYVLRREKKDVLADLPSVLRRHETLDLTSAQKNAYRTAIRDAAPSAENFLALFNELRMICDLDVSSGASSKLDRIEELLAEIKLRSEKAIVFSYTLEPLRALRSRLEAASVGAVLFTGDLSLPRRSEALAQFRSDEATVALLASTRMASEGLTLTEANNVIFVSQWWNPSSNQQAEDRVVRLGQELPVSVHTFTCRHTVEASLERILKRKGTTFDVIVNSLSSSPKGLEELFEEPP